MCGSHEGNMGGVVPDGRIAMDIDAPSGGLESIEDYIRRHGPTPRIVAVLTGGGGYHYYFRLHPGVTVPSGGSLVVSDTLDWNGKGLALRLCSRHLSTLRALLIVGSLVALWAS